MTELKGLKKRIYERYITEYKKEGFILEDESKLMKITKRDYRANIIILGFVALIILYHLIKWMVT